MTDENERAGMFYTAMTDDVCPMYKDIKIDPLAFQTKVL